jgi:hypothetical protein
MGGALSYHSRSSHSHSSSSISPRQHHYHHSKKHQQILRECKVWHSLSQPTFVYPELEIGQLDGKSKLGIAVNGGGSSSAALTLGTIRGLHRLGLLQTARYISVNSSSAWIVGPQAYSLDDITKLFGEYFPPEQCHLRALKELQVTSQVYLLCHSQIMNTLYEGLVTGSIRKNPADPRGFWSQVIGQLFLKPYELNCPDHLTVLSGSQDDVRHRAGISTKKMSILNVEQFPFLIINSTAHLVKNETFTPVEFTPLYHGLPAYGCSQDTQGGYLIESFAFLAHPSESSRQEVIDQLPSDPSCSSSSSVIIAEVPHTHKLLSISQQVGLSSFSPKITSHDESLASVWNPLTGETNPLTVCDGSVIESTGIHALLRRNVTKIFAMYAVDKPLFGPSSSSFSPFDHQNYCYSNFAAVAGLFGVMTASDIAPLTLERITIDSYNRLRQVFPSEDYLRLIDGLRARLCEGKSCSYLLRTTVLPNHLVNVLGGYEVEILFLVNAPSENWINLLPNQTKRKIFHEVPCGHEENNGEGKEEDGSAILQRVNSFLSHLSHPLEEDPNELKKVLIKVFQNSKFDNFPFLASDDKINEEDYSAQCMNLLSQLMTWEVLDSEALFDELLKESSSSSE